MEATTEKASGQAAEGRKGAPKPPPPPVGGGTATSGPQSAAGGSAPQKKRTLVDAKMSEKKELDRKIQAGLERLKKAADGSPVQLVQLPNRIEDLLKRQDSLPPIKEEEIDFKQRVMLAFPKWAQSLHRERYFFKWVNNPENPRMTQYDIHATRREIRAFGLGGIFDFVRRTSECAVDAPESDFTSDGVVEIMGMILAYTPMELWQKKRDSEVEAGVKKLDSTLQGYDEDGKIPLVKKTMYEMGDVSEPIPDQPGMDAELWTG